MLQGDVGYVNVLDFSADDHRFFSGSNDRTLILGTSTGCLIYFL